MNTDKPALNTSNASFPVRSPTIPCNQLLGYLRSVPTKTPLPQPQATLKVKSFNVALGTFMTARPVVTPTKNNVPQPKATTSKARLKCKWLSTHAFSNPCHAEEDDSDKIEKDLRIKREVKVQTHTPHSVRLPGLREAKISSKTI